MSLIKAYAVGSGAMFYIEHNSDNFTIIDCSIPDEREGSMLVELSTRSRGKGVVRFISTHPDQDHIRGLIALDDTLGLTNFYCVDNQATKSTPTSDFDRYCELRDGDRAFHLYEGCSRRWMNKRSEERGSAGLNVLWPIRSNPDFKVALNAAAEGQPPNNISCIIKYGLENGVIALWMGDLETDFMETIEHVVELPKIDILFAPHHGRASGRVPASWLDKLDPSVIVIGEAPSAHLHYYTGYDILTQNSSGDLLFDCDTGAVHVYAEDPAYSVNYLEDHGRDHSHGLYYVGSFGC